MTDEKCSACGGDEHLRSSWWHGETSICMPCFLVWYDPPGTEPLDITDPKQVGALSLEMKAAGKWPWTGKYAAAAFKPKETDE